MVQVIETGNPHGKLSEMLGMSLGEGIGNGLNTFFANRSLESVMKDKALEKAPISKKLEAMRSALSPYGEKGQEILQQRMAIEQQAQNENTSNKLSKALGYLQKNEDIPADVLEGIPAEYQLKLGEFSRSNRVANGMYDAMINAGVPQDIALNQSEVIRSSPKGAGQTYGVQGANELINRYRKSPQTQAFSENIPSGKMSKINPEFEFPLPQEFEGLTMKEKADLKKENAQNNLKDYNQNIANKKSSEEDKYTLKKLEQLNPHIRTGWSKWNINPVSGEIIFPGAATPEEKQFNKLIVRELRNAKESFGAKVSNFEADKFLQGFPNLADTPEARAAVIKDLQLMNEITLLHAKAKDEVHRLYKPQEISSQEVSQIARDMIRPQVEKILEQFSQVNPTSKSQIGPEGANANPSSIEDIVKRVKGSK